MRVISQDGKLDFPYENSVVFISLVDASEIRIVAIGDDDNVVISKYSTEEKAKKAMEELRYAYMCHSLAKMGQTPPDGIDEKLTMGLIGVFQFPTEEELE